MMNKAVYIATLESHSGKSLVSIGLMNELLIRKGKVGYFRPVIDDYKGDSKDNHILTMIKHFNLELTYDEAYGFTRSELIKLMNKGQEAKILDIIIRKYKKLEKKYDFILLEGSDFSGEGSMIEFELNVNLASNLSIPTILVSSGISKSFEEYLGNIKLAYESFKDEGVAIPAIIANKIKPKNIKKLKTELKKLVGKDTYVSAVPRDENLLKPSMRDVLNHFNGKVLFGEDYLEKPVKYHEVGAMQLRHYLTRLRDKSVVITPGDRADLILGAIQADKSYAYPNISGMVLTGGIVPEKSILKLIEGIATTIPIVVIKPNTFEASAQIADLKPKINPFDVRKIMKSISLFKKHIDVKTILDKLIEYESKKMTPSMFLYNLEETASKERKTIVLPEGTDIRILKAACRIQSGGLVDIVLLGDRKTICNLVKINGINLDCKKTTIIDPNTADIAEVYAEKLLAYRKHKGMTETTARDLIKDVSYFGTMMVQLGDADGMVSGAAHTTQHTIRPALQIIKTKPDAKIVSSVFFMCLPDRVSAFADCAINPNPNAEELAEIAIASADSACKFGVVPKVAMLSYSSGTSGKGEDVEKVRAATEIVKKLRSDILIEGPIQYDAAVDMKVGKSKLPNSEVAGQASVLIFPDLNTGNNTYKAVQRETGALAIGPMLQGLNKPVNDLSRGCTVADVYNTILLTAIQAQEK
jgi:phosphate acetyltransferase